VVFITVVVVDVIIVSIIVRVIRLLTGVVCETEIDKTSPCDDDPCHAGGTTRRVVVVSLYRSCM